MVVVAIYTILDGFQMSVLAPNRTRITELTREGTLNFVLLNTFVLPVAFMTTIPAQSIIGRQSATWLAELLLTAVVLFIASRLFWRFALRYCTSASS